MTEKALSGFSGDAVEWLLGQRDVAGLGTECIDVELGWKTKNEVKLQLAAANKVSLVQVMDELMMWNCWIPSPDITKDITITV